MQCPACGAVCSSGSERCAVCGAPFAHPPAPAATGAPGPPTPRVAGDGASTTEVSVPADEAVTRLPGTGRVTAPFALLFQPGQRIAGRYTIVRLLGLGGMGAVYEARDHELNMPVALKTILPKPDTDPVVAQAAETRFRRELLLARQITHKNVVCIHDIGEFDGVKFISMALLEGCDLARLLRREGRLEVRRALAIAREIAEGLAAAHEARVVHRDLKPANIMIDAGDHAKLMDFGIARSSSGPSSGGTAARAVVGTVEYMAPEQARAESVDARADVYAFGLILFEMLTGPRPLLERESAVADLLSRMTNAPVAPRALNPDIPPELDALVTRCLQVEPSRRFAHGEAVLRALNDLDDYGRPVGAPRRQRRLAVMIGAALAAGLALAAGARWIVPARPAAPAAAPREPVSVLIANFENRARDPIFDGTLAQTLALSIEGATFIAAYPQRDALRLASQIKPGAPLDEGLARLVARREGIDIVLAGAISGGAGGYALELRAVDGASGREITLQRVEASTKDAVLTAIGRLSAGVRRVLGDATPEADQLAAAETFTAASLEALHAYAQAQEAFWAGRYQDAIAAYKKVVALDATLGRAYAGLAVTYNNLDNADESRRQYQLAMKYLDRMSERERFRTLSSYYLIARNPSQAIEASRTLVERYPADTGGLTNLAFAHFLQREMTQAQDVSRRALRVYPENVLMRNNLALYAMYAGDFETARSEAAGVLQRNPAYAKAFLAQAIAAAVEGDLAGAASLYERLQPVNASMAAMGVADLALYRGRPGEAAAGLPRAIDADLAAKNQEAAGRKLVALAEAEIERGRPGPARERLRRATDLTSGPAVLVSAARAWLALGDRDRALNLADRLGQSLEPDSRAYVRLLEGESHLVAGNPRAALKAIAGARVIADPWIGSLLACRAHVDLGELAEARTELDGALKRRGEATALFLDDVPTLRVLKEMERQRARLGDR